MIGMTLKAAREGFFDRPKVQGAVDAATKRVLSKFGAFVRQRAKTSIRQRKKVSAPGQPPSSHLGLLKKFLFFAYDQQKRSVVVGPTQLNRGDGTAPRLLEQGGTGVRMRSKKQKQVYYRPRPFMQPAFQAELPGLSRLWANAVR